MNIPLWFVICVYWENKALLRWQSYRYASIYQLVDLTIYHSHLSNISTYLLYLSIYHINSSISSNWHTVSFYLAIYHIYLSINLYIYLFTSLSIHISIYLSFLSIYLQVNQEGLIDVKQLQQALTINTALVTIMHSNNEVGTIQPLREIVHHVKQFNQRYRSACILVHSDAAQSLGKVVIDVQSTQVW